MKKSTTKRIRVTRNGKVVRRSMNVNHFRTRKSKDNVRQKRKGRSLDHPIKSILNY